MFEQTNEEKRSPLWKWPAVLAVIVIAIAGVQLFRVNKPPEPEPEAVPVYTPAGTIVKGGLVIAPRDFYSARIDLNRRSKLLGEFRTPKSDIRLNVFVLSESEFENWRSGKEFNYVTRTGNVPAGRINLALEPGVFFLVMDNRENDSERRLDVDFSLER